MTRVGESGRNGIPKGTKKNGSILEEVAKNFMVYLVEFICVQQEPNFDSMGEKVMGSFGWFIHRQDSFNHIIMMQCTEQKAIVSQRPVRPQIIDNIIFCEVMTKNKV